MPELIEVEIYRQAALATVGQIIESVTLLDELTAGGHSLEAVAATITGRRIGAVRRLGKLLMFDMDGPVVLGMHFGMTGRLVVGAHDPIARLEYGARTDEVRWDRFAFEVAGVGTVRMNDPRRLGRVTIDPDEGSLGPDAATITTRRLVAALAGSRAPLKPRLLDQRRIAGIGNLLADEILWRARLAPLRQAGSLDRDDVRVLATGIRRTIAVLTRRGGSHMGDLQAHRTPGSSCPRCHRPLRREQVGGRTSYWCPNEQN